MTGERTVEVVPVQPSLLEWQSVNVELTLVKGERILVEVAVQLKAPQRLKF